MRFFKKFPKCIQPSSPTLRASLLRKQARPPGPLGYIMETDHNLGQWARAIDNNFTNDQCFWAFSP